MDHLVTDILGVPTPKTTPDEFVWPILNNSMVVFWHIFADIGGGYGTLPSHLGTLLAERNPSLLVRDDKRMKMRGKALGVSW